MVMPKKYFTEEEKKAAHREVQKRYREKNPEKVSEIQKRYYQNNTEKVREYQKKYREENHEKERKRHSKYYQENKEKINQYREDNKEHYRELQKQYYKQYYNTPMGRACNLINAYKQSDKKHNRGECTLTPEWMIENIFSKPCHYCGEEGWEIMGCDRIDNSKPHTPDNVVPCCDKCNKKRGRRDYEEFMLETMLI